MGNYREEYIGFVLVGLPRIWALCVLVVSFIRLFKGENDYMENYVLISFSGFLGSVLLISGLITLLRKKSERFRDWWLKEREINDVLPFLSTPINEDSTNPFSNQTY